MIWVAGRTAVGQKNGWQGAAGFGRESTRLGGGMLRWDVGCGLGGLDCETRCNCMQLSPALGSVWGRDRAGVDPVWRGRWG